MLLTQLNIPPGFFPHHTNGRPVILSMSGRTEAIPRLFYEAEHMAVNWNGLSVFQKDHMRYYVENGMNGRWRTIVPKLTKPGAGSIHPSIYAVNTKTGVVSYGNSCLWDRQYLLSNTSTVPASKRAKRYDSLRCEAAVLEHHTGSPTGIAANPVPKSKSPPAPGSLAADREELLAYADLLEREVMEIGNGKRKPGKVTLEGIVKLIHYARTGKVRGATLNFTSEPSTKELMERVNRSQLTVKGSL